MALTQPPFPRSSPEWLAAIGPVLVAGGAGVVAILGFGFLVRADPQAISWMVLVAAGVTGLSAWHVVERVGARERRASAGEGVGVLLVLGSGGGV